MNQDKFIFTAVDWLVGIVASAIVTSSLMYVTSINDKIRCYRMGWHDGAKYSVGKDNKKSN